MRALITGGNGFLGSHLAHALAATGHTVRTTVQKGTGLENLSGIAFETAEADLSDPASIERAAAGCDVVYHLAARVADYGPWKMFFAANVQGTQNVIDAAVRAKARRLVFMSSLSVHGFKGWYGADEKTPLDSGGNPYARSKIEAEGRVGAAGKSGKLETVIVRPGYFPFGARDRTSFVPLAEAMKKGLYRRVGAGTARVCTAYAENLAQGLLLCGTQPKAAGETFVLCDDGAPTWNELNDLIARHLRVRLPRIGVPAKLAVWAGDSMEALWKLLGRTEPPILTSYRVRVQLWDLHFSNAKAKQVLGFKPSISLEDGMARTVEWYRSL